MNVLSEFQAPSRDLVSGVLRNVLESMYFCEVSRGDSGCISSPALGASVEFSGVCNGELRVIATSRLSSQLGADFLGTEVSGISPLQAQATVNELANIVCGALLGAWMPEGDFQLSIPLSLDPGDLGGEWPCRFAIGSGPEQRPDEPELAVAFAITGPGRLD